MKKILKTKLLRFRDEHPAIVGILVSGIGGVMGAGLAHIVVTCIRAFLRGF